jgi:hypothetical protein
LIPSDREVSVSIVTVIWIAGKRKPVITVMQPCYQRPREAFPLLPWVITGEADQGGREERGESRLAILSPWERAPKATSTMEKRSEVIGVLWSFQI